MRKLTHGSTFSGIGAPEVAAEMLGIENLFHCEINPFGRKVLDYWFPKAESYEDITKTDFAKWRGKIDILTGGFPCQPFSYAGERRGAEDDRYLWPFMLECIQQVRPTWFVGENVAGITTMVLPGKTVEMGGQTDIFGESDHITRTEQAYVLDEICRNLENIGYSVQPVIIPACAVGAPHRRDRIFIIAHDERADGKRETGVGYNAGLAGFQEPRAEQPTEGTPRDGEVFTKPTANTEHHGLQHSTDRRAEEEERRAQSRGGQDGHTERIQPTKTDGGRGTTADANSDRGQQGNEHIQPGQPDGTEPQRNGGEYDAADARNIGLQERMPDRFGEDIMQAGAGMDDPIKRPCNDEPTLHPIGERLEGKNHTGASQAGRAGVWRDFAGCSGQNGEDVRNPSELFGDGRTIHGQHAEKSESEFRGTDCGGDRQWRTHPHKLRPEERWREFPTVSPVCRGNDGIPGIMDLDSISAGKWRTETLKAYGNAIVVQVIYSIFKYIQIVGNGTDCKSD